VSLPARSRSRAALHDSAYGLHQNDARDAGKRARAARSTGVQRRRRASRRGGDERRRDNGEPVSTTQSTGTASNSTGDFLTLRRRSGAVTRQPGGDGSAG
jgi:hypothetical protein